MISNLATTVFCCINEMFHFQRDCQDIVETVLHCSTTCCFPIPPQHQNKVLCLVFSRRTVTLFLTLEDTIFSKFSSIQWLGVPLCLQVAHSSCCFVSLTRKCQFYGMVTPDWPSACGSRIKLKTCTPLPALFRASVVIIYRKLLSFDEIGVFLTFGQTNVIFGEGVYRV